MSVTKSGGGPGVGAASWANERLPLSLRKELLQRELSKLGYRGAGAGARAAGAPVQQQQQQQPPQGERPQAGTAGPTRDGD